MPKIIFEREKCIGCGACQAVCPKDWEMADNGKAILVGAQTQDGNEVLEVREIAPHKEAVDTCPVQCIIIE